MHQDPSQTTETGGKRPSYSNGKKRVEARSLPTDCGTVVFHAAARSIRAFSQVGGHETLLSFPVPAEARPSVA